MLTHSAWRFQYALQSDRDFEKMLKVQDKQTADEEQKKSDKKRKSMEIRGKKGMWQDDKVDSGEEVSATPSPPQINK